MSCYHPVGAFQIASGSPLFFGETAPAGARKLYVGCGQCIGCRLDRAREWGLRCECERKMHDVSCFATFTYNDECLPEDGSLDHRHYQLFAKRLRRKLGYQPRYFMCGEYGEALGRPHYHSALFGYWPEDAKYYRTSGAGFKIYRSDVLDELWKLGDVYIGHVSFQSAAYIARYSLKMVKDGSKRREILNVETGEVYTRAHEYCRMSRRPAIGRSFIEKFGGNIFELDSVRMNGVDCPVPRYFNKLLEKSDKFLSDWNRLARERRADAKYSRLVDEAIERGEGAFADIHRFAVHEVVKLASIKSLRRD